MIDLYLRLMPRTFVSGLGYLLLTGFFIRWSVGSVLFLLSWAVLMGPWTYAKHLVSGTRLPFTAAYFGSIALTLYFAIGVSKIDFFIFLFSFSFSDLDFVFDLYALPRCAPTILPLLMILPSAFACLSHTRSPSLYPSPSCRTAQPGKGEFCSLHTHRAVQPESTACHACCWPQLLWILRIYHTLRSAVLSTLTLASVPRPTTVRDLDVLSLTSPCPTPTGVTERGVQSIEINLCLTVPGYQVILFYPHITTTHHPLAAFGKTSSSGNSC